jgi:hypothetical protein
MTETYWHLLDEDEWAELIRSEQSPSMNGDPIALEDYEAHNGPNGSAFKNAVGECEIAYTKAPPIAADLASLLACLGIPLQAVSLAGGRRRMALDRLSSILRERSNRPRG